MSDSRLPRGRLFYYRIASATVILAYLSYFLFSYYDGEAQRRVRREQRSVHHLAKTIVFAANNSPNTHLPNMSGVIHYEHGDVANCSYTSSPYVWMTRPSTGKSIPIEASRDADIIFFACSQKAARDGRRSFVFPAPVYSAILRDTDVDWSSQTVVSGVKLRGSSSP